MTVIVPVYNNYKGLESCLGALEKQTICRKAYHVIVADNGSRTVYDDLRRRFQRIEWLGEPRPGSYAARNAALQRVSTPFVAFTDSDCVPSTSWLERGLQSLERDESLIVGGRIDYVTLERPLRITEICEEEIFTLGKHEKLIADWQIVATANLFTSKALFDRVGVFDATLKSGGDREWCHRAVRMGARLAYCDRARIFHKRRDSYSELQRKVRRLKGGLVSIARREPTIFTLKHCLRYTFFDWKLFSVVTSTRRKLSVLQRLALCYIIGSLVSVGSWETLRVAFGGETYRGEE